MVLSIECIDKLVEEEIRTNPIIRLINSGKKVRLYWLISRYKIRIR